VKRVLSLDSYCLYSLHDVQARAALLQLGALANLDVKRPQLTQITDGKFIGCDRKEGPRTLTEARDNQSHVLVVVPKAAGGAIPTVWVATTRRQEDCAKLTLLLEFKQFCELVVENSVDGVTNQQKVAIRAGAQQT